MVSSRVRGLFRLLSFHLRPDPQAPAFESGEGRPNAPLQKPTLALVNAPVVHLFCARTPAQSAHQMIHFNGGC
jgi:hypothetical protein